MHWQRNLYANFTLRNSAWRQSHHGRHGTPIQTLPLSAAHLREVDILGIFRYTNTYATGIRLLSAGCLPSLDDMATHRFKGLGNAQTAFELAGRTADDEGKLVLKVVIEA